MSLMLENVWKVFGPRADEVIGTITPDTDKDTLREETGHTLALRDVTLEARASQITVVMGLSGSGKSTLLRAANRLIEPTRGAVLLDGEDLRALDEAALIEVRRTRMAMIFQHFALLPHRSVIDNIAYGLEIRGLAREERRERAARWLDVVGLTGYGYASPRTLSGGMRQRVGLARGLATDADILLMDEPFSALDPLIRREMQDLVLQLQTGLKKTILFITHDLDEALRLGDTVAIMKDGAIVQSGTARDILLSPRSDYVRAFARGANRTLVLKARDVMTREGIVTVSVDEKPFAALKLARDTGTQRLIAVDDRGRPKGIVTADAARRGASETARIHDIMEPIAVCDPMTPLEEVVRRLLTSDHPLAVAPMGASGPTGKLEGLITRAGALAGVAGGA